MKKYSYSKAKILCVFFLLILIGCLLVKPLAFSAAQKEQVSGRLTVFYAAGLNTAMEQAFKEFKKIHPKTEIIGESSGTLLAIRKITELNKQADLIFVADALSIRNMLIPKYADWYISFYKDRVVIAYTDKSKYTNEIDAKNWYKILVRPDVKFGYANPNLAPIGYRTLMAWQLADLFYKDKLKDKTIYGALKEKCPKEYIMPDVAEMLHILESLFLDYGFVYESTAKQHNLKYIRLPEEIDLGSEECADLYKQAIVEVTSSKTKKTEAIKGSPVTFAFTILKDSPNYAEALEFAKFFLGAQGQKILAANDQTMIIPCVGFAVDKIPDALKPSISGENK
ncbi:MAG: tungstate ABC transporter substrate-binding protein WtpA [Candidatus Omnitrophica bacterium]|nr:tungstate ABC transporter substrate-binding protein WtpA [Candidatus Omnitrophota bacterium]